MYLNPHRHFTFSLSSTLSLCSNAHNSTASSPKRTSYFPMTLCFFLQHSIDKMLRRIIGICIVLLIIAVRTYQQDDFAWIDQSNRALSLRGGTANPGRGRNLSSLKNLGILDGGVVPEDEVHSTSTSGSVIGGVGGRMLRVPCSIAVNSSEATNHASSRGTSFISPLTECLPCCRSQSLACTLSSNRTNKSS